MCFGPHAGGDGDDGVDGGEDGGEEDDAGGSVSASLTTC